MKDSKTEEVGPSFLESMIATIAGTEADYSHHRTEIIGDDGSVYVGTGSTAEEAESNASEKYQNNY